MSQLRTYTFWRLRSCAADWASSESLAADAWLESAKDPPREWHVADGLDLRYYALYHRVLEPLYLFGLLEKRLLPGEPSWMRVAEYRVTPLYDRFLRISFASGPAFGPLGIMR
jgi:hypothetical protein